MSWFTMLSVLCWLRWTVYFLLDFTAFRYVMLKALPVQGGGGAFSRGNNGLDHFGAKILFSGLYLPTLLVSHLCNTRGCAGPAKLYQTFPPDFKDLRQSFLLPMLPFSPY